MPDWGRLELRHYHLQSPVATAPRQRGPHKVLLLELGAHGLGGGDQMFKARPGFGVATGLQTAVGVDPHLPDVHLVKDLVDTILDLLLGRNTRGVDVVDARAGLGLEVRVVNGVEHH